MFGKILIYILLALSIGMTFSYLWGYFKNELLIKYGRNLFYGIVLCMLVVSGYFLANIISHNFQFFYIWSFSSKNLSLFLLISTFFAGQEGSFMLWALLTVIIGMFLLPNAKRHGNEALVMGIYSLMFIFLFLMLISKSPFEYIWDAFKDEHLAAGFTPPDGKGLNPILENFWMIIHPPILFIGYALMAVPYSFAIAALIKRDYSNWLKQALPWTLIASGFLGLGIALGGFWSYETLGWGGFWAWDPVENSSLMPWVCSIMLIHTLLVQKRTGGLVKTNILLSILTFVLVLYSTFLTRSGILGKTSVHSFIDPGSFVYTILMISMFVFMLIGIILFFIRFKELSTDHVKMAFFSREFMLSLGAIFLFALTMIVFIGTSWPIITVILGKQSVAIDIGYYTTWNLPIAILIMISNAVAFYFSWKSSVVKDIVRKSLIAFVIALVPFIIAMSYDKNHFSYLFLGFIALFSILINGELLLKSIFKNPMKIGSYLSHIGLALLLIGAIGSGVYSEAKHVMLELNSSKKEFGYNFKYSKKDRIEKQLPDREKYQYTIQIDNDASATPILYWSNYNNKEAAFQEPGIKSYLLKDIYISPKSDETSMDAPSISLKKMESSPVPIDSAIQMTLMKFDMSHSMGGAGDNRHFKLGTVIMFNVNGTEKEDTLYTNMDMTTGECDPVWYNVPGTQVDIGFIQFVPNRESMALSSAIFTFKLVNEKPPEPSSFFVFEVATKPLISLVWVGSIFMVLGFFIAFTKRITKKESEKPNVTIE